jgi:hypothetical protein
MENLTRRLSETQPLLVHLEEPQDGTDSTLMDFDPEGDPDNPLEWSNRYRMTVVSLLAFMAFTV